MKIGVYDSGIGGLTVLAELERHLRSVHFIYLGDTAHVPYGTKSAKQIRSLATACAQWFKVKKVDALIVACNTASSLALSQIQKTMGNTPVFGMVKAGAHAVASAHSHASDRTDKPFACPPILILATRATIQSGAYRKELKNRFRSPLKKPQIFEQPCPLLVPMIEEGWISHPVLKQTLQEYVSLYAKKKRPGTALLACTHYPWIQKSFEKALPHWKVINSAEAVRLEFVRSSVWKNRKPPRNGLKASRTEWFFTDPDALPSFALPFLGRAKKAVI